MYQLLSYYYSLVIIICRLISILQTEDTKATLDKLNIQIRFSDNARGSPGGGRGGRGRGRGFGGGRPPRRGRGDFGGGFRNNRQDNHAPMVDNESEFPSLGSK